MPHKKCYLHGHSVVSALSQIRHVCGCIRGERLQPFLPETAESFERHGELELDEVTKNLLLQMSPATIDRKLLTFHTQMGR